MNEGIDPSVPTHGSKAVVAGEALDGSERKRFQILALDGGGYRGMFSAAVLAALEEDHGSSVLAHFDLVVGTSTGGLIALGLGAGIGAAGLVDLYLRAGSQIFPTSPIGRVVHLFRSKYDARPLRRALHPVIGDRILGDSQIPLVIPAYDLSSDCPYLFKTPHHPRLRRDWREKMVDVALATTAAPTYFPAHPLQAVRLIDGGVWANNPAVVGIAEAVSMFGAPLSAVRVFSLGTTSDLRHRHRRLDRGGALQWATAAVDVILRGQSLGANNTAMHLLGEKSVQRVDPPVPVGLLGLDKVNPADLMAFARKASRDAMPRFEAEFCDHTAPPYKPFHSGRQGG